MVTEDVFQFMKMAKTGELGQIFGRIDIAVLNDWLDIYLDSRIDAIEERERNRKSEYNKPGSRSSSIPGMTEKLVKKVKP